MPHAMSMELGMFPLLKSDKSCATINKKRTSYVPFVGVWQILCNIQWEKNQLCSLSCRMVKHVPYTMNSEPVVFLVLENGESYATLNEEGTSDVHCAREWCIMHHTKWTGYQLCSLYWSTVNHVLYSMNRIPVMFIVLEYGESCATLNEQGTSYVPFAEVWRWHVSHVMN